jgi:hypothetical protein
MNYHRTKSKSILWTKTVVQITDLVQGMKSLLAFLHSPAYPLEQI